MHARARTASPDLRTKRLIQRKGVAGRCRLRLYRPAEHEGEGECGRSRLQFVTNDLVPAALYALLALA